jgi:hypothetical protein
LERRPYFIFGDLLACTVTGAAAGWITYAVIPGDWHPLIGMALGMVGGMLIGTVGGLLFAPLFGDLEVALPVSLGGMVAGSATSMPRGMDGFGPDTSLWVGALAGLACLAYTYVLQARLHGETK